MNRATFRKMVSIGNFSYWDYEDIMADFKKVWSTEKCIDYLVEEAKRKRRRCEKRE